MPKKRHVAPRLDDFVEQQLASLLSYTEVVDIAMAEFDCDERTVTRAIARVREAWKVAAGAELAERRATFQAELAHAWRLALAAGDYRAVGAIARVRADVLGVRAPTKVEVGGELGLRPVAALSPQEREAEIQRLLAKRAAALGPAAPAGSEHVAAAVAITAGVEVDDVDREDEDEDIELAPDIRPARRRRTKRSVH